MIQLERHIEILLLSNDCVIVPDFGGFMAHYAEARFDQEDNTFLPPLRTIGFNPQLTINDSLLVQSYIEAYDISYPEALGRIASEVDELKQELENSGRYEMNDIGTFTQTADGRYLFEPCEAGILTPALYGLSGYTMTPLAEEASQEAESLEPSATARLQNINVDDTETEETSSADFIRVRKSLLHNIAAACIAIIAFFALSTPLHTPTLQQSSIDTSLLLRLLPAQETSKPAVAIPTDNSTETTLKIKATQQTVAKSSEEQSKIVTPQKADQHHDSYYTIVLASKVSRTNAQEFVKRLQRGGIESLDIVGAPGHTKVVAGRYASEQEARSALRKMHETTPFSDSWITRINN